MNLPPILRGMLSPVAALYSAVVRTRAKFHETPFAVKIKVSPRVVSVGNLTVGGTGKTPFTLRLAELLRNQGYSVVILSHGYKRGASQPFVMVSDGEKVLCEVEESGDEAQIIAMHAEGIPVVAGSPKWQVAQWIERRLSPQWIVLDDGFQHLRLVRDFNILLLDAKEPFGNGHIVPSGTLREPVSSIRRADLLVLVERDSSSDLEAVREVIRRHHPGAPILSSRRKFSHIAAYSDGSTCPIDGLRHRQLLAFCGLGQPAQFFDSLHQEKLNLTGTLSFPDHHRYRSADVRRILQEASRTGAEALITTAKDKINLEGQTLGNWSCYVFEIKMIIPEESRLLSLMLGAGERSRIH